MNQLAHSRNRRNTRAVVTVRTRGPSESTWKSTATLMAGAAIGGVFMYKGHVMTGAGVMLGTLLVGGYYDTKDS